MRENGTSVGLQASMSAKVEVCLRGITAKSMRATSTITNSMVKASSAMHLMIRMAKSTAWDSSNMTSYMDQAPWSGQMVIAANAHGYTIKWKAQVLTSGRTESSRRFF